MLRPIIVLALVLAACGGSATTTASIPRATPTETPPTTTLATPTTTTAVTVVTPPSSVPEPTSPPTTPAALTGLRWETVATGLHRPLLVTAPAGDDRRFIVQQDGVIWTLAPDGSLTEFLAVDAYDNGIEQGLLGLAFHPRFADNGRFFIYYSIPTNDTRLVEYRAAGNRADPDSARVLLEIPQPTDRHNAGMLQFGPDGYLYVALGEGGAAADNAQNPDTLLGSILRLDVDGGDPYAIPPDNPFRDGEAPEVWAVGLRNPWRFTIDGTTMYIGDVGHSEWEEVDAVPLEPVGYDFGWLSMEGTHCFRSGCDPTGLVLPVVEYPHSEGCSVTGGIVYRGRDIPEIEGLYFYSDWCTGFIRSFRLVDGEATEMRDWTEEVGSPGQVTSFGTDAAGEMYTTTWDGNVFRLVADRG